MGSKFCNKCGQPVEEPVAQNNNPVPHNRPQTKTANKSNKSNDCHFRIVGGCIMFFSVLLFLLDENTAIFHKSNQRSC